MQTDIDQVIEFLKRKDGDSNLKKTLVELLSRDLIHLDSQPASKERKALCHAIQNLLGQLEDSEAPILLQNQYNPRGHLPEGGDSLRAVMGAFDTPD